MELKFLCLVTISICSIVDCQCDNDSGHPSGAPLLNLLAFINSTAISLSWDEVKCTDRNGVIPGYSIRWFNTYEGVHSTANNSGATNFTITGLTEFRLYEISVAAMNNNEVGPYSQEWTVYTEGDTELQGLSLNASTTFVQLSWQAPCCSDIPFEYEVAYAIDPDCSSDHVSLPNAYTVYSQRTVNDTINVLGLMPNSCYVFGVRAYESVSGIFGNYSIINGNTISGSIDVSDNSSNTTSVRLSWSTLPSVSIDSYSYEVGFAVICSDRDCSSIMLDTLPQNYTSYTNTTNGTVQVNGLIADTCYVFGVRVPPGQWTIQLLQTDDLEGDDLEGIFNLSVESSNTTSVQLSWSILPNDSYSYEVGFAVISSDRDCSSIMLDTLPQNYTSFTNTTNRTVQVNGLIADTCYVFGVRVLCLSVTAALGQWTIQLLQTDDLEGDDLEGICNLSSNTTSVRLSWSTLTNDSYSYEVGYAVISDCSSIKLDTLPQNYTSFTYTTNGTVQVNGLIADTCYAFGVRVPPGQSAIQLLQIDVLEGIFNNLSVEISNTTSVRLSWSTLPSDSYSYEVGFAEISSDRDCSSMLHTLPQYYASFIATTNGTVQVNDLTADTCYVFGVRVLCLSVTAAPGRWTTVQLHVQQTDRVQLESIISSDNSSTFVSRVVFTIVAIVFIIVIIVILGIVIRRTSGKLIISSHDRENGSYEKRNVGRSAKISVETNFTDIVVKKPTDEPCTVIDVDSTNTSSNQEHLCGNTTGLEQLQDDTITTTIGVGTV